MLPGSLRRLHRHPADITRSRIRTWHSFCDSRVPSYPRRRVGCADPRASETHTL